MDQNGNQIISKRTKPDGSFDYAYSYVYDKAGNKIRENRLKEDGTTEYYTLYEYNTDGQKTRSNSYYPDGTLKEYELYGYHANGKIAYDREFEANGLKKRELIYDENGEITYYASYSEGKLSTESRYRTLSDGTKQRQFNMYFDGELYSEGEWENE